MDRRLHKRFDVSAPVTYTWSEQGGKGQTGQGTSRDVSETGLYVVTDSCPPVGSVVNLEVSFTFRDDSRVQLRASGIAVRVEAIGNSERTHGFAASTKVLQLKNTAVSSESGSHTEH
jgi:hypothetical protein